MPPAKKAGPTVVRRTFDELDLEIAEGTRTLGIDPDTVDDYAAKLDDPEFEFPPLAAVVGPDGTHFVWDGAHRAHAYRKAGRATIPVEVVPGTWRDAKLASLGANDGHGKPRTNKDKVQALDEVMRDSEWSKWSTAEISRRTHLDHRFIERWRQDRVGANPGASSTYVEDAPGETRTAFRGGKAYEMNVSSAKKGKNTRPDAQSNGEPEDVSAPPPGAESDTTPPAPKEYRDRNGALYPPESLLALERQGDLADLCRLLDGAAAEARRLDGTPQGAYLDGAGVASFCERAKKAVLAAKPAYVCPKCQGQRPAIEECTVCKRQGWVSRFRYETSGYNADAGQK